MSFPRLHSFHVEFISKEFVVSLSHYCQCISLLHDSGEGDPLVDIMNHLPTWSTIVNIRKCIVNTRTLVDFLDSLEVLESLGY